MRRVSRVVLTCVRVIALICALLAVPRWALADGHEAAPVVSAAADGGAAPAPGTTGAAASTSEVKIRDKVVFTFRVARADKSPAERAKKSQAAIDGLLAHPEELGPEGGHPGGIGGVGAQILEADGHEAAG